MACKCCRRSSYGFREHFLHYRKEGSKQRQFMLLNCLEPTASIYKAVDLEKPILYINQTIYAQFPLLIPVKSSLPIASHFSEILQKAKLHPTAIITPIFQVATLCLVTTAALREMQIMLDMLQKANSLSVYTEHLFVCQAVICVSLLHLKPLKRNFSHIKHI